MRRENHFGTRGIGRVWLLVNVSAMALACVGGAHAQQAPDAQPPVAVPKVQVTGGPITLDQVLQQDATTEKGYVPDVLSQLGFLGQTKIEDTPFTVSVMPKDLIENIQAPSLQPVLELNPAVQIQQPEANGVVIHALSRGFFLDTAVDGFQASDFAFGPIAVEDVERAEILEGPSGFLNGGTVLGPGGLLNYVLKRPTANNYVSVEAGTTGGSNAYVHGDFGGPIPGSDGKVGYRLNVSFADGATVMDDQNVKRWLVSTAFDFHLTDSLLLQIDASRQSYRIDAPQPGMDFGVFQTDYIVAPPDPKKDYGEPYSFERYERTRAGLRMSWDVNSVLSLRVGYRFEHSINSALFVADLPEDPQGNYEQELSPGSDFEIFNHAGSAAADLHFNTGPLEHKLTLGFFMHKDWGTMPLNGANLVFLDGFNFSNAATAFPVSATGPEQIGTASPVGQRIIHYVDFSYLNRVLADQIQFTNWLSGIVGVNYSTLDEQNYSFVDGSSTTHYRESKATPSGSIIAKPLSDLTVYATYIQGLENGGIADSTLFGGPIVTNPGAAPPTVDRQYEIGAKWKINDVLLTTLSLFDLDKANQVYFPNPDGTVTYSSSGREDHRGGEFTVTGKVLNDLTIYGGATVFRARVTEEPDNPALVGSMPVGVSETLAKLYAEYGVPVVPGLVVTGGIEHYGRQAVNQPNTTFIPSYSVFDVGARYSFSAGSHPATLRVNVYNVGDKRYWSSPNFVGSPLDALFSIQVQL